MSDYSILENSRIEEFKVIPTPDQIKNMFKVDDSVKANITVSRMIISNIINGEDNRKLVIIGPCSIHNVDEVFEYSKKLMELHNKYKDKIYIVIRAYFSKPRTTIGWKGICVDPDLNGSCNIEKGLMVTRQLLVRIAELGLPMATEFLDCISPQYFSDLISFGAIGARTTESQVHRELVSGLSCPTGFKNGTDGNITIAGNAIKSARAKHTFLGCVSNGTLALVKTKGNLDTCIILRGGIRPNYDSESIRTAIEILDNLNVNTNIVVDCSHGNSGKDYKRQSIVARNLVDQIQKGNKFIVGMMIESYLNPGRQELGDDPSLLIHGVSITDSSIGWEETEQLLEFIATNI